MTASRYGEVLVIEEPVIISYSHPRERCLFNSARDANPFLYLYESLWMLAGRRDVAPLAYYTKRMAEFSDDGKTFNGAYGHRWRKANHEVHQEVYDGDATQAEVWETSTDQLKILIDHLRRKPESRRAVIQMWDVEDDLLKIDTSKDVCCNLSVCFSVENGNCPWCKPEREAGDPIALTCRKCGGKPHDQPRFLNMTVFNRSNDLVWGALGTNVVHFSFLQEYVATHLGLDMGIYHQVTNNLHCYTKMWEPEKWLADRQQDWYGKGVNREHGPITNIFPLVKDPATFNKELPTFVERNSGKRETYSPCSWQEPFLDKVAQPMLTAFRARKEKWQSGWRMWTDRIQADDWRITATTWCERREVKSVSS